MQSWPPSVEKWSLSPSPTEPTPAILSTNSLETPVHLVRLPLASIATERSITDQPSL